MSGAEIAGTVVIAFLIVWGILITVLFLKALEGALNHADRIHERNATQLETTLDRLMAMDFTEFKSAQYTEHAPAGEYVEPDTEIMVPVRELGIE